MDATQTHSMVLNAPHPSVSTSVPDACELLRGLGLDPVDPSDLDPFERLTSKEQALQFVISHPGHRVLGGPLSHVQACAALQRFISFGELVETLVDHATSHGRWTTCKDNERNTWVPITNYTGTCRRRTSVQGFVTDKRNGSFTHGVYKGPSVDSKTIGNEVTKEHLWYHGTNGTHAMNIAFEGININASRPRTDFCVRPSFYVTTNREQAVAWARALSDDPALVVFSAPFLPSRHDLGILWLHASTDDEKTAWKQHVAACRTGDVHHVDRHDALYGPCALFPTHRPDQPQPSNGDQMAIRGAHLIDMFDRAPASIVWISPHASGTPITLAQSRATFMNHNVLVSHN